MYVRKCILLLLGMILVLTATADDSTEENSSREPRQILNFIRRNHQSRQARACTTPHGKPGRCSDIRRCAYLLLDIPTLVRSICFQDILVPGTCCPIEPDRNDRVTTTAAPTTTTTLESVTTKPSTKPTPKPEFTRKPTTTTTTKKPTTTPEITTKRSTPKQEPQVTTPTTPVSETPTDSSTTVKPYRPGIAAGKFTCGVSRVTEARVVNGTESYPGKWPWMAAVYLHGFLSKEFHCGGTIISKRYILTAAHCTIDKRGNRFSPSQLSVRLGDHDISRDDQPLDAYAQTYKVESITVHPDFENFSHQYFRNDMAILKLSRAIEFSSFIGPVCLPSKAMQERPIDYFSGYMGTVIGYGRTSYSGPQSKKLLEADMPIWWNGACDDAYFPPILDTNVCAGYVEGGIDSCQGDSGGPLLINRGGRWVQIGIVSFGQRCAEPGYPGVYTRVPKFVTWIKNNI